MHGPPQRFLAYKREQSSEAAYCEGGMFCVIPNRLDGNESGSTLDEYSVRVLRNSWRGARKHQTMESLAETTAKPPYILGKPVVTNSPL